MATLNPTPVQPFGGAFDEEGNLLPGYQLDENNDPVFVPDLTASEQAALDGTRFTSQPASLTPDQLNAISRAQGADAGDVDIEVGITEAQLYANETEAFAQQARQQQTFAQQRRQPNNGDWRVKLSLAPNSDYLYKAPDAGLLEPLKITNGVIFPYTPGISTNYKANYDSYDLTHSNYRGYYYRNSYTDAVSLTAQFTAQDTVQANYLLAVITFFKSVTKMFYGQDAQRGAPPPLVYITGLGQYQFNGHPCVVSNFSYNLPADVDYIRAGSPNNVGLNLTTRRDRQEVATNAIFGQLQRLASAFTTKGALPSRPGVPNLATNEATYVPTKMEIQLTLLPIQSRSQVSKQFSLKNFANGNLIKGGFW
jgi:hypothetical protein